MHRTVAVVAAAFAALCFGCGVDSPTSPTSPPSGTVFRQGNLRIPQTYIADLDAGALVSNPYAVGDVWFEAVTQDERYLAPTGALLAVSGTTPPGFAGCKSATLTSTRIPIGRLSVGLYLCARTDEGRIAELRVGELPVGTPPAGDPALTLGFTIYNK